MTRRCVGIIGALVLGLFAVPVLAGGNGIGHAMASPVDPDREGDIPIVGDWNGTSQATAGVVRDGRRYLLRNFHGGGPADITFTYGRDGDTPIVGDWNSDGVQTIGVIRPVLGGNLFLLRNSNSGGPADISFRYGRPGDTPIAGDWNGDGITTIGVARGDRHGLTFHLRNSHSGGPADITFSFGPLGRPIAGNWNAHLVDEPGSDKTTVGVHSGRTFYLVNEHRGGPADITFTYGRDGDVPLVGNFTGHTQFAGDEDNVGVRRDRTFLLRRENSGGPADITYTYGR